MERIALITGAAGGVGSATVEVFNKAGWTVLAVDRSEAGDFPESAMFFNTDVSDPASVAELFEAVRGKTDHLDALVNNAAIQICKPLIEMHLKEWDTVLNTNLRSVFLMAREAYGLLANAKSSIINVSSVHAVATSKNIAAYAASKGGMVALTRAMAIEFADAGVRVNAILPGAVDTQMLREGLSRGHVKGSNIEDQLKDLGRRTILGRVGNPREIAQSILFLADEEQSSFMTGQALVVDGGATIRLSTE
ncbi:MAG: SDR family oxidoreductase [Anaerolineales bacterium]|nr:SDR family oxidoreductase [Anaerolineales bacterium]